jgi:galactokinase
MRHVAGGPSCNLPDVDTFLPALDDHGFFDPSRELFVARAPGRLDLMGGIADYSGSLVLEAPLREAAIVALQRGPALTISITSLRAGGRSRFEMPVSPLEYAAAREFFQADPEHHWAAYIAGAFFVLMRERGVRFNEGARILVSSSVPEGKGVSSSASLEVAVMAAVCAAFDIALEPRDMALLCQKTENLIAGAPCGVMDQMTTVFGHAGALMALLCQPAELQDPVPLPEEVDVWGLDSGVRHCVSGADYGSVRVGAFMGRRILSEFTDIPGGYLANLSPAEFESAAARLPERITGAEFLGRFGETGDTVTRVVPEREYAVRVPAAHPVYENHRVKLFRTLLAGAISSQTLELLGDLMYQSHASYSACGLGCEATDLLVSLVREAGPGRGLYGAKITGGGSGGTVAILARRGARTAVESIAEKYAGRTGHKPYLFHGSSPGAAHFGYLKLCPFS